MKILFRFPARGRRRSRRRGMKGKPSPFFPFSVSTHPRLDNGGSGGGGGIISDVDVTDERTDRLRRDRLCVQCLVGLEALAVAALRAYQRIWLPQFGCADLQTDGTSFGERSVNGPTVCV